MKMNGIYAYESQRSRGTQFVTQKDSTTNYEVGQTLEGIISNVSDQISIDFSGREVKAPLSAVKNAKEGETRTFQIMDVSKNGIVLKEVGSATKQGETQQKNSLLFTQVDVDASTVVKENSSSQEEEQADVDKLSSTMTEKDYEELKNEGISLKSYSLTQLERALERVKSQRNERTTQTKEQVVRLKSEVEKVREMAHSSYANHPALEQIVEQLLNANMPVTFENISKFVKAQDMTSAISQISDSSASYLIKNELPATIENIYKAVHSGEKTKTIKTEDEYLQVQDSIEQLVEEGQYENKQLANDTAKWLFLSDLPVTDKNIEYKIALDQLKEQADSKGIHQSMVEAVKSGENPEKAKLLQSDYSDYELLMQQVDQIEDSTIVQAVTQVNETKKAITLQSLLQLQSEKTSQATTSQPDIIDSTFDVATITAKRQLEEIRLKLTFEASIKLSMKGFQIETEELSKVVEELKNLEQVYYESVMKNVTGSVDGTNELIQVQEAVSNLKQSSTYLLAQTYSARHSITVGQLSEVSFNSDIRFKQAETSYEALMTSPRKDLGDSIQKAFANVDSQLDMLGMETTTDNQRAVRILGYNSMELSVENVTAMKAYDARVNELISNLTPDVTAALIKDKQNPLYMTVDQANELACEYKDQLGDSEQKKYGEFLVDLEAKKEITAQEREAYIGIYRLLNQVEQSDGAAIGALVKSGKELTLNNLLTEVRTKKQGYMDVNIDDTTPMAASSGYENSITASIDSYYMEQTSYGESLVRSVRDQICADSLYDLKEEQGDGLYDMSIETIRESISLTESSESESMKQVLNQLTEAADIGSETLTYLDAYGQIDSLNHIFAVQYGIQNSSELYNQLKSYLSSPAKEKIKEQTNQLLQRMGEEDDFKATYEQLTNDVIDELSNSVNEITSANAMKDIAAMYDFFALNQTLSQKNNYNIPVKVKGNTVNMNLTVLHNSQSKGQIRIQLPVDEKQTLTVQATVINNQVNAWITTGNQLGVNESEQIKKNISNQLSKLEFEAGQIHISCEKVDRERFIFASGNIYKESQTMDTSENEALTSDLFQVSKVFVEQLIKLA